MSLGDPTHFGNLLPPPSLTSAISSLADSHKDDGYIPAVGSPALRSAVAQAFSEDGVSYSSDDVVVASGCSGALELLLTALLNPGDNVLVPRPGFPLYEVIANSHGASVKYYDLDPDQGWNVDLKSVEAQCDSKTRGIVINNPSNPCGSVFGKEHLKDLLSLCSTLGILPIGDEVYGGMTFPGSQTYHSLASVSATLLSGSLPVVSTCGMAKQYLVPGWRVGWLTFYGPDLADLKAGVHRLAQVVLGACSLAQAASARALGEDLNSFKRELNEKLAGQAAALEGALEGSHGLTVVKAQGAMYTMVKLDPSAFSDVADDVEFTRMLLEEFNVFALPGSAFGIDNFFRAVYCAPEGMLKEAGERIKQFCKKHKA